ncbi:MAG: SoxR reducing system RseC family protein [Bacteroidales bacterium]|nr:SoxR reducing system RseC family protein [Bacteroidales bacterium]
MSRLQDTIIHPGIIQKVGYDKLLVNIIAQSACSACHAKGMCSVADMKEKIIEVHKKPGHDYKAGEKVSVAMEKSMGTKAVMIGYIIPFLIVFISLIILTNITNNQGFTGLISLGLLIPYYLGVYLLRDKLKKTFIFRIQ